MNFSTWAVLAGVCLVGAMSPGPSLALVLQASVTSSRRAGLLVSVSHGVGIFVWAILTASGMGLLLMEWPEVYRALQVLGCLYLVYLGVRSLLLSSNSDQAGLLERDTSIRPLLDGFLIAITNPKIAFFFLALFSQFVRVQADWTEKVIMASTAAIIDALWYGLVAVVFSSGLVASYLEAKKVIIDRTFGIILIALACYMLAVNFL